MGLKIMSHTADELSYPRTPDNKNCLSIVKNYEKQSFDRSPALQKGNVLDRLMEFFSRLNGLKYKNQQQQLCDTPLRKIHLQVNTDLKALEQVLDWYEQLENLSIPQIVFQQCQLVLAEGFTNAVRHAHKGLSSETPIELEVTVFNESLEMRIWDYGQPFDLEAKLSELKEREGEVLQEGGRGLNWIVMLTDRLSYTRTSDERNCLVIVKRLQPSWTF
jgi:serine/threonine-protein kinase RsbW